MRAEPFKPCPLTQKQPSQRREINTCSGHPYCRKRLIAHTSYLLTNIVVVSILLGIVTELPQTTNIVSEEESVSQAALRTYLRKIEKAYQIGNATEQTYRIALQELLEAFFSDIAVTNEPKRVTCGAPNLIVTHKQIPPGYIETKDIGISLCLLKVKKVADSGSIPATTNNQYVFTIR